MAIYGTDGNDVLAGSTLRPDNDTIFGLLGNDVLWGYGGDDYLDGGEGNDTLDGGTGTNTLIGGLGNDSYVVRSSSDIIIDGLNQGRDFLDAFVDYTLTAGAEIEDFATRATRAIGNELNNRILAVNNSGVLLDGKEGNDTISGWYGSDQLYGGTGDDNLDGTDGNDFLYGGTGNDQLYGVASGPNSVNSDTLYGEAGNDSLYGSSGNDILEGGDGNDLLDGEWLDGSFSPNSIDSLTGGRGNDTYIVDSISDSVQEAIGQGTDTVQSSVSLTLSDNVENLTLLENNRTVRLNGAGNGRGNTILGNSGENTLNGRGGADTLIGGSGSDILTGGAGGDRFVYNSDLIFWFANTGPDAITDFQIGVDKIVLTKSVFSQLGSAIGNGFSNVGEFGVVTSDDAAATSTAKIVYNSTNGKLFYNSNGNLGGLGSGGSFAVLSGNPPLAASDFLIQA